MEEKNKSFEKYERVLSPSKIPFTKENYAEIKELLYQGESLGEIRRKTGRATSLIGAVRSSKSYEGYYMDRRKIANRQYAARHPKKTELPQPLVERLVGEKMKEKEADMIKIFNDSFPTDTEPTKEFTPTTEVDARKKILNAVDEYVALQVEIKLREKLRKLLEEA